MKKEKFIDLLGCLVGHQTYQCYQQRTLKGRLRNQKRYTIELAKALNVNLTDKDIFLLFQRFNCWDIDEKYLRETLSLKS